MTSRTLLSTLFLLTAVSGLCAQELVPRTAYGVYGDFNLNQHFADFRAIPGVPNCCPQFESGSGTGFSLGLLYEMPLTGSLLLDLRAGYGGYDGVLKRSETTLVDREGNTVTGEFEHTIDAKLPTIGIEPLVGYRLFGGLTLHAGARVAYAMTPTYAQREVIVQPSTGTFAGTSSRVRNEFSGDLPNAATLSFGLLGGVSYELPMNRTGTLRLAPEILYGYGLTGVVKEIEWSVGGLRAGIAVKYAPLPPSLPMPSTPPVVADVEEKPKQYLLAAKVSAVGLRADGVEEPRATMRVEEFLSTRLRPLLNYLFFDEGSSTLPDRYQRLSSVEASAFHVERLYNEETLPTYYHLLNIVGRRMLEHPEATISIVGCNNDQGTEHENMTLSRARAEAVRDYLRDTWGIAESRMKLDARGLPAKPSNMGEADGVVENRRAEIYSDTWDIVAPVFTHDTIRTANPPSIRFHPEVRSEAGVHDWKLTAAQNGEVLRELKGNGEPPRQVEWRLDDPAGKMPRSGDPLRTSLEVHDVAGNTSTIAAEPIPIEQITIQKKRRERIGDKEIDRFSLILFDFDKGDLNDANQRIVKLLTGYIKPTSTVTITGHTDRMGEDDYNRRLSTLRATMASKAIGVAGASATGVGEAQALYDNELPEGRFYNRTVEIVVETEVGESEK